LFKIVIITDYLTTCFLIKYRMIHFANIFFVIKRPLNKWRKIFIINVLWFILKINFM